MEQASQKGNLRVKKQTTYTHENDWCIFDEKKNIFVKEHSLDKRQTKTTKRYEMKQK